MRPLVTVIATPARVLSSVPYAITVSGGRAWIMLADGLSPKRRRAVEYQARMQAGAMLRDRPATK